MLSDDQTLLLRTFEFTKRERVEGKPSQLTEEMISNMLNDKAKQIAVDKIQAYHKSKQNEGIIEEESNQFFLSLSLSKKNLIEAENKGSAAKEGAANGNKGGMILLEDDEDDIVFEDPKAKNGNQELLGKRVK